MKEKDLIKRLKNVKIPRVEIRAHREELKASLLNFNFEKKRNILISKNLLPIGVTVSILIFIFIFGFGKHFWNWPILSTRDLLKSQNIQEEEVKESVDKANKPLKIAEVKKLDQGLTDDHVTIPKKTNEVNLNKDSNIITSSSNKNEGVPPVENQEKVKTTAEFYIETYNSLDENQIQVLKNSGVKTLSPSIIYKALIEKDRIEGIKKLDFVKDVEESLQQGSLVASKI